MAETHSFGLLDSKHDFAATTLSIAPAHDDLPVDPETTKKGDGDNLIVVNPPTTMAMIYKEWSAAFTELQNYKYVLTVSKRRVRLGSCLKIENHFLVIYWILLSLDDDGSAHSRKIYKRVQQRVMAFVRPDPHDYSQIIVALRPRNNKSILQDFLDTAATEGVEATLLTAAAAPALAAASSASALSSAEDDKSKSVAEPPKLELPPPVVAAEVKPRKDELIPFPLPGDYDASKFSQELGIHLGDVNENDIAAPINMDIESPKAGDESSNKKAGASSSGRKAAAVPELTPAQLNAKGKQTFKDDEIHEQIWSFVSELIRFFDLSVQVYLKSDDGSVKVGLHETVFCVRDLQYTFENQFGDIEKLKEAMVHIWPLLYVGRPELEHELRIKSITTGEYLQISKPNLFSFQAHFLPKDNLGYIFHKARMSCNETDASTQRHIYVMLNKLMDKLVPIITAMRQRRMDHTANKQQDEDSDLPAGLKRPTAATKAATVTANRLPLTATTQQAPVQQPALAVALPSQQPVPQLPQRTIPVPTTSLARNLGRNTRAQASSGGASSSRSSRKSYSSVADEDDENLF